MRLRVTLKLRGTGDQGRNFEELATTENVSLSGFLCSCTAKLPAKSIVEVYLTSPAETYVGTAKIVHAESKGAPLHHYGCCFIEKTGPWVLQ